MFKKYLKYKAKYLLYNENKIKSQINKNQHGGTIDIVDQHFTVLGLNKLTYFNRDVEKTDNDNNFLCGNYPDKIEVGIFQKDVGENEEMSTHDHVNAAYEYLGLALGDVTDARNNIEDLKTFIGQISFTGYYCIDIGTKNHENNINLNNYIVARYLTLIKKFASTKKENIKKLLATKNSFILGLTDPINNFTLDNLYSSVNEGVLEGGNIEGLLLMIIRDIITNIQGSKDTSSSYSIFLHIFDNKLLKHIQNFENFENELKEKPKDDQLQRVNKFFTDITNSINLYKHPTNYIISILQHLWKHMIKIAILYANKALIKAVSKIEPDEHFDLVVKLIILHEHNMALSKNLRELDGIEEIESPLVNYLKVKQNKIVAEQLNIIKEMKQLYNTINKSISDDVLGNINDLVMTIYQNIQNQITKEAPHSSTGDAAAKVEAARAAPPAAAAAAPAAAAPAAAARAAPAAAAAAARAAPAAAASSAPAAAAAAAAPAPAAAAAAAPAPAAAAAAAAAAPAEADAATDAAEKAAREAARKEAADEA